MAQSGIFSVPGLGAFIQARQVGEQTQAREIQGLAQLLQMQEQQANAPLRQDLLRAQVADAQAKPQDRIDSRAATRETAMARLTQTAQQFERTMELRMRNAATAEERAAATQEYQSGRLALEQAARQQGAERLFYDTGIRTQVPSVGPTTPSLPAPAPSGATVAPANGVNSGLSALLPNQVQASLSTIPYVPPAAQQATAANMDAGLKPDGSGPAIPSSAVLPTRAAQFGTEGRFPPVGGQAVPVIQNADGTHSTERTITIEADGRHLVIPTIVGGQQLTPDQAVQAWRSGQNREVGAFPTAQAAESYARSRSSAGGALSVPGSVPTVAPAAPSGPQRANYQSGRAYDQARARFDAEQGKPSIAGGAGLGEKEARNLAVQALYDPNALSGFRRDTRAMGQIQREQTKVMEETGITNEDIVAGRAGFKADDGSLRKLVPQYDAITAFENTAKRNGKLLVELAEKVDVTGVPVIEKWIRAGRQATGDPDVAKFNAQLNAYRPEVARILIQPNLSGVLSDSARHEAEGFIQGGASAKQIKAVVSLLERDFDNRKQTLEEQIGLIRNRMRLRLGPGAAEQGGLGVSAPGTAPATAPQGRKPLSAFGG